MYKTIFLILLLINEYEAFSIIGKTNFLQLRNSASAMNMNMERRDVLKIARFITLPMVFNKFNKYSKSSIVYAEDKSKSLEDLRDEAYRIIEIIDAQKDSLNLPVLGADSITVKQPNNENNFVTKKEAKNITEKEEIKNTLDIILTDFKNNGRDKPEIALKTLQTYCSESNVIKKKDVSKLRELFADGKYGILLGKFDSYYITNYNKLYDTDVNETYYEVDVKIEAPYNTMIRNSIQFDEMYYPEFSGDPCYIFYRWIFVKRTDKYMLDGCYLLHKNVE
jgi:hypothetical protein